MSLTAGTKRPLPPKVAKMKERKKQKLQNPELSAMQQSKKDIRNSKGPLRLDDLQWNEVELPDQMEDYEGFFGLEEIEGVDVVRDQNDGKITYKMIEGQHQSKNPNSRGSNGETWTAQDKQDGEDEGNDEDEWGGIEDDMSEIGPSSLSKTPREEKKQKAKTEAKSKKAKKEQSETAKPSRGGTLVATGFSVLKEDEDDHEDADVSAWHSLDLFPEILSSLSKLKFASPTEIQSSAIPHIFAGHDVIGKAPTGSGKTLAYGLPIIQEWLGRLRQLYGRKNTLWMRPSALVIVPTRELAHQITAHLKAVLAHIEQGEKPIGVAAITGGLSIQKQRRIVSQAQIVVGTPGRLWEVIRDGQGMLGAMKRIKFLVLDEADRLLSEGHFKELEEILNALDKENTDEINTTPLHANPPPLPASHVRQTLVFSATFSKSLHQSLSRRSKFPAASASQQDTMAYLLRKLNFRSDDDADGNARKPRFVDVNPVAQMAANLREGLVECPVPTDKDLYLYTLLLYHHPGARALVFANSVAAVRRLAPLLNNLGLATSALHSHMPQKARLRSVERFSASDADSSPQTRILLATDIAARGLDIPNVSLVLHYNVPRTADAYVHRSGRTARAAAAGSSILLCAPGEAAGVRRLVAQVHARAGPSSSDDEDEGGGGDAPKNQRRKNKFKLKYKGKFNMHPLTPSARLVAALRPRVALAKRLADSVLVGQKQRKEDDFFRAARAELRSSDSEAASSVASDVDDEVDEDGEEEEDDDDDDDDDNYQREAMGKGIGNGKDKDKDKDKDKRKSKDAGKGKDKPRSKGSDASKAKGKGQGKGKGQNKGEHLTKSETTSLRAELQGMLKAKVNVGVSEKYLVGRGGEEVARLLREREGNGNVDGTGGSKQDVRAAGFAGGMVLGSVDGLGWDI